MNWKKTGYDVIETLADKYFFAGSVWNTQVAKRFILKSQRFGKIIESSYYLHLKGDGEPFNIAFEPSTSFGCSVGCLFCASGDLFPIKSLSAGEIAEQVDTLVSIYQADFPGIKNVREDVFYSGIGEPTLMANTLIDASHKILEKHPEIQFKMSTMGAVPSALIRWAKSDLPLRSVQVGIPHWSEEKIRHLYSKCSKYSLQSVLEHVKELMLLRPEVNIKINYIGLKNYNDSTVDLIKTIERIVAILGNDIELKISCLNPTDFAKQNLISAVDESTLMVLATAVKTFNLKRVYTFGPMNKDKLGCGQLAGNYSV